MQIHIDKLLFGLQRPIISCFRKPMVPPLKTHVACAIVAMQMVMLGGCVEHRQPMTRQRMSSLANDESLETLNARANNPSCSQASRADAVFKLFAHHLRPRASVNETRRVLTNTSWIKDSQIKIVRGMGGWLPMERSFDDSLFHLTLFPEDPKMAWSQWDIWLCLSGHRDEKDAIAFLRGSQSAADIKLVEYLLCYPPTSQSHGMSARFERFSREGVHTMSLE